jgi:hypothetical protein
MDSLRGTSCAPAAKDECLCLCFAPLCLKDESSGGSVSNPSPGWQNAFSSVSSQGKAFDGRISPSNQYYSFLSSCEQDETTELYYAMFEIVPYEWFQNVYASDPIIKLLAPPRQPASLYMMKDLTESQLLTALGQKSIDDVAAGSWYLLVLTSGTGSYNGTLLDANFDIRTKSVE